ncbi:MAG: PH domain-containing protein [Cyanobacteria bacterium P01_G01_bin.67]
MEVFSISPASTKPLWFIAVITTLLALVFAIVVYTGYSAQHSRVELRSDRLTLVGDLWGRTIPLESIDVSQAMIVNQDQQSEYSLKRRTFGTGLPGYASGWFRLRNGEKALVYLTRNTSNVYLPTSLNYILLLSVEQPERFIETLQRKVN